MPPKPRKPTTPCRYPIGDGVCGAPSTCVIPAASASFAEDTPMCSDHAARYLGAAVPLNP